MERLTDKFKCEHNTGKIVNAHNASKQQVIDKLAAYEDTGKTPEQVQEWVKEEQDWRLVVRCQGCELCKPQDIKNTYDNRTERGLFCHYWQQKVYPDDFCNYGERKDDVK